VGERAAGRVSIQAGAAASTPLRSRELLSAVADGRMAMANMFGGALVEAESIFALTSLPFVVEGIADAPRLYEAAQPAYEDAFERHHQKLLYATPWPPSGLWSRAPIGSLAGLRVRTYDATGTAVFERLGARARSTSFADLLDKLAAGEIDAALSSGDGGAGLRLSETLPHFTAIAYAIPTSFTTVNLDRWRGLDPATRAAVEECAALTGLRQWEALEGRIERNYSTLRQQGVTIATEVPAEVRARLRAAGRTAVEAWFARAGEEERKILERR
jgi:TRAP-type C4-dicarboxylate transport system substrate-binding protein